MIRFTDTTLCYIVKRSGSEVRWTFADAELARSNASDYSARTNADVYVYEQDRSTDQRTMIDTYRNGTSLFN